MLISIIIPLYNREKLLIDTIFSIQQQSNPNWECVIIDDGSTDNSYEVATEYSKRDARIRVFKRPENHKPGGNGARNFGLSKAKGSHICWFDSDDLMHTEFINEFSEAINKNTDNEFFICDIIRFKNDPASGINPTKYYKSNDFLVNQFSERKKIYFQNSVLKTDIAQENLLDESLTNSQDYAFISKIVLQYKPVIIQKILVKIRIHDNNISSSSYSLTYIKSQFKATETLYDLILSSEVDPTQIIPHLYFRNIVDLRKAILCNSKPLYQDIKKSIKTRYLPLLKHKIPVSMLFNIEDIMVQLGTKVRNPIPKTWYKVSALLYKKLF